MGQRKATRRARQREARRLRQGAFRGSGRSSEGLESVEFASVFLTTGGRRNVGASAVAYDCDGKRIDKGTVPHILEIGRDKATEFMRLAEEALEVQARKDSLRVKRGARQTRAIIEAHDSGALRWVRMDSDDDTATMMLPDGREIPVCQQLKSYLVGSSDIDEAPLNRGLLQVVCFRGDDKRWYVGEETYDSDSDSRAIFVPLFGESRGPKKKLVVYTYPSEDSAQRSILAAIELREFKRLNDRLVGDVNARIKQRLRVWARDGEASEVFEEFDPKARIDDSCQRITTPKVAARVRPRIDDLQTADVSAKQKFRVEPLTDIQLTQNRVDSE